MPYNGWKNKIIIWVSVKNSPNTLRFSLKGKTGKKNRSNFAKLQFLNDDIYINTQKKPRGTWQFCKMGVFGRFYHSRILQNCSVSSVRENLRELRYFFFLKIPSKICSHKYQPVLLKKPTVKALPNLKLPKHMKKRFIKKLVISMAKLTEWIWMNSKWLAKVPTLIVMDVRMNFSYSVDFQ